MSKGSRPRPFSVSQEEFANSFDRIFRKPDPKVIEDQNNEDKRILSSVVEQRPYKAKVSGSTPLGSTNN